MPPDRYLRPGRSLLSEPYNLCASHPQPPPNTRNTDVAGFSPAAGEAATRHRSTTLIPASVANFGCSAPSQTGRADNTPMLVGVSPMLNLGQPQSSLFRQAAQFAVSVQEQHRAHPPVCPSLQPEHNSPTLPQTTDARIGTAIAQQHTQPNPAHPPDQSHSLPYHSQHTSHQYHQAEHALQVEALLESSCPPLPHTAYAHLSTAVSQHTQPHSSRLAYQAYPPDQLHHLPHNSYHTSRQYHQAEQASRPAVLFEQQYSLFHPSHPRLNEPPSHWQYASPGSFEQAHDFVINHATFADNTSDSFMASLLEGTIKGAEFDSSDRHMPLRCHPGTRVNIIKRCQDFILNREGRPRLRWVVGSAGVGKSAIMQSVAHDESDVLSNVVVGATIFFSINGRQDGTKTIATIAYQLAVKLKPYQLFVQHEVTRDPSLLRKSLPTQFKKFIVEPFIFQRILDHSTRLLIIIDGLDECAEISVQKELLSLISFFCVAYPTSPIVWMIASRPEPHITSFFSRPDVALSYEKEEILVDTDEAREDVNRYLRDKFREIQLESITLQHLSQWPSEDDYLKVANASGGLLAYASTVVRYIGDPEYGDPVRLLEDVVTIIERGTKENIWGRNHPMAQLDALYSHIMSKIPANVMANTRKLLLLTRYDSTGRPSFLEGCNMLEIGQNTAYSATHHIRAIAKVPGPTEAAEDRLEFFHKSFYDYLSHFERSGFSPDFYSEADQLMCHAALRILKQAPDGVYRDDALYGELYTHYGILKNGPGTGENIALSWPDPEANNYLLRFHFTFAECRRRELLEHGILKQVPLHTINHNMIKRGFYLHFRGPAVEQANPWSRYCKHKRDGAWEGDSQDWSTSFTYVDVPSSRHGCYRCSKRFFHQFETRQSHLVTVLNLTPEFRMIEFRFIDPDDGVSEWIYSFKIGDDNRFCSNIDWDIAFDDDDDDDDDDRRRR